MAIKDSAETWVRGKPMLAVVAVAAVGLVVGALIGLGVGFKVEQGRTRDDVSRLKKQLKSANAGSANGKVVQRVGEVTTANATTLGVKTKLQGPQTIQITSTTPFETTKAATVADIAVGRNVLVATGGHEVIILPTTSKIGRAVSAVATDSFSVSNSKGKSVKVKTSNVKKVYTLVTGASTDAKVGADVIVAGQSSGTNSKTLTAVEVIVLPAGSAFNS